MASRRSVYLILGSNLHRPLTQLAKAKLLIEARLSAILKVSAIYKTEPWGNKKQPAFYNQVIKLQSSRLPLELLTILKGIEHDMGRTSISHWGPRVIDIDILFFGKLLINSKVLTVPHPRINERRFVLTPLAQIAPRLIHPLLGTSMQHLLHHCTDSSTVKKT